MWVCAATVTCTTTCLFTGLDGVLPLKPFLMIGCVSTSAVTVCFLSYQSIWTTIVWPSALVWDRRVCGRVFAHDDQHRVCVSASLADQCATVMRIILYDVDLDARSIWALDWCDDPYSRAISTTIGVRVPNYSGSFAARS